MRSSHHREESVDGEEIVAKDRSLGTTTCRDLEGRGGARES